MFCCLLREGGTTGPASLRKPESELPQGDLVLCMGSLEDPRL